MLLYLRSLLLLCTTACCYLLEPPAAQARHIIGGEMTYQFLEKNGNVLHYRITLKLFRDCAGSGPNFDSTPGEPGGEVTMYSGNSILAFDGTFRLPRPKITKLNPKSFNPCLAIPRNVCVEEGVYTFDVAFANRGTSFWIVYQRCCRNFSINNIYSPGDTGATYYVEITKESQALADNSPQFEAVPPPVLCVNEYFEYDYSAIDKEGDSLVYRWCSPLRGGGIGNANPSPDEPPPYQDVPYRTPGFTPTDPLGLNILTLSQQTGILSGIPPNQGQYVMGFCVESYRNGVLLCTVRREFQLNVTLCEPVVFAKLQATQDANGIYQLKHCGADALTIMNTSQDEDYIKEYEWRFDLDSNQSFETQFSKRNVTINQPIPGQFNGFMVINPNNKSCRDTAFFTLKVLTPILPEFTYTFDSCAYGPVTFINTTVLPRPVESATWIFDGLASNSAASTNHEFDFPGTKNVVLQYTDTNNCIYTNTQLIPWYPLPPALDFLPPSVSGCAPLAIAFDFPTALADAQYELKWDLGDGIAKEGASIAHVYTRPGTYDLGLTLKSPVGCTLDTVLLGLIQAWSVPVAQFTWNNEGTPVTQLNPEVQFINQSTNSTTWSWNFSNGVSTNKQHPKLFFRDTGLISVVLIALDSNQCADTLSKVLDIEPVVTLFLPNAFTPNQDGLNETYRPKGLLEGFQKYYCAVFNKWGEVVFESTDPNIGWNGQYQNAGSPLPADVYVCQVFYTTPRGKQVEISSEVLLLR